MLFFAHALDPVANRLDDENIRQAGNDGFTAGQALSRFLRDKANRALQPTSIVDVCAQKQHDREQADQTISQERIESYAVIRYLGESSSASETHVFETMPDPFDRNIFEPRGFISRVAPQNMSISPANQYETTLWHEYRRFALEFDPAMPGCHHFHVHYTGQLRQLDTPGVSQLRIAVKNAGNRRQRQ